MEEQNENKKQKTHRLGSSCLKSHFPLTYVCRYVKIVHVRIHWKGESRPSQQCHRGFTRCWQNYVRPKVPLLTPSNPSFSKLSESSGFHVIPAEAVGKGFVLPGVIGFGQPVVSSHVSLSSISCRCMFQRFDSIALYK